MRYIRRRALIARSHDVRFFVARQARSLSLIDSFKMAAATDELSKYSRERKARFTEATVTATSAFGPQLARRAVRLAPSRTSRSRKSVLFRAPFCGAWSSKAVVILLSPEMKGEISNRIVFREIRVPISILLRFVSPSLRTRSQLSNFCISRPRLIGYFRLDDLRHQRFSQLLMNC